MEKGHRSSDECVQVGWEVVTYFLILTQEAAESPCQDVWLFAQQQQPLDETCPLSEPQFLHV